MLQGKEVYLRPLEPDRDLEKCFYWIYDPEVAQFVLFHPPYSRLYEKEWLEKASRHGEKGTYTFAIVIKSNDVHIGNCGLHGVNPISRNAELGIMIGDRHYWGKGFGTDAMKILCQWGFEGLNLHKIFLKVYDFNKRGIRCYEKTGFKQEGVLRQQCFLRGAYHDEVVMGLIRDEFQL
ncbi:MAG: GNAT family protein [Candidatus Wallbacteria bacterium]|nr:GNAT family protein [Candidatus Wallbacteria bacterium]